MSEPTGRCSLCGGDASIFPSLRHIFRKMYQDSEGRAHRFDPKAQPKRGYDKQKGDAEASAEELKITQDNSDERIREGIDTD